MCYFVNFHFRVKDFIIVIHAQIACEIDIRTLTSHQVLGQIFDQVLGQILDQIFDQILDQVLQCTVLLGQKRLHAN